MFKTVRVLVVDDQLIIRQVLQMMLETLGCQAVFLAQNGDDGLASVATNQPHVIICDVRMAPMDGIEFLRRLRRIPGPTALLPVVMLTSQSPEETAAEMGNDVVPNAYLQKPVGIEPLKQALLSVMTTHES